MSLYINFEAHSWYKGFAIKHNIEKDIQGSYIYEGYRWQAYTDDCNHWQELEAQAGHEIDSAEDLTAEEEELQDKIYNECEEYQIDQYIYDTGNGYYGAKDIDRETKRAYILQNNEYAEAVK